ncbi:MAG: Fic family protein [Treponema sp.]|nr:Fic family protein [Treponema sp.]
MKTDLLDYLIEEKNMRLKGGLYHYTQIKFAYNSNRIEGSRLSEEETRYIFETNTISTENNKAVNVDDIIETVNHFSCFNYILETANHPLSEDLIKEYHRLLKQGTSDSKKDWFNVGDYKSRENIVGDMETTPAAQVTSEMSKLLSSYVKKEAITINDVIDYHYHFEKIHPFQDGNGRVGRLIMFKECLKNKIVPFIIQDEKKQFYYRGLKEYTKISGYLIDTCLHEQDVYKEVLNYFKINVQNG